MIRLITPLIFIVAGSIYLILSFFITKSKIGDPNAPLYFPVILGTFIVIMSIVYFFQEWKNREKAIEGVKALLSGRTPKLIFASIILIIVYTFLFERIGYLFSTILFLTGLLFAVNGRKPWFKNILIAVIFSFISWYSFAELLKVSLP